jgi:hypothetical protein
MPTTVEQLYQEALSLPLEARADLTERLVATLAQEIPSEITRAQLDEVHRRVAQVESGEVALIPGDEALARVHTLLAEHRATAGVADDKLRFSPRRIGEVRGCYAPLFGASFPDCRRRFRRGGRVSHPDSACFTNHLASCR